MIDKKWTENTQICTNIGIIGICIYPSPPFVYMLPGMQIKGSYLQSFSHLLANVVFVGNRNILHVRFNPWWLQLKTKHIVILYTVVFTFACLRKLNTGSRVARDCVSLLDFEIEWYKCRWAMWPVGLMPHPLLFLSNTHYR